MLQKMLTHNRFFTITTAAAIVLALLAATVNVFVGPFNAFLWLVPAFMLVFAVILSFLLQVTRVHADSPFNVNWMVRALIGKRLGKRVAYIVHCPYRSNMRIVSPVFVYFVPSLFLVLAVALLILSVRGQITPGG